MSHISICDWTQGVEVAWEHDCARVTENLIRPNNNPGELDPLTESICWYGSGSNFDPPQDQFY